MAAERDVPVLVLRGEWGTGKSLAFEQELEDLLRAGIHAVPFQLGSCGPDTGRAVLKLEGVFRQVAAPGERHVLLDGLDEGLEELSVLGDLVAEQIEALDEEARAGLRVRISCRTQAWVPGLSGRLARLFKEEQPKTVALAPLSRDDVALAAQGMDVSDVPAFLALLEQRGLVALATHPGTLRQLLTSYAANGILPGTAAQAYREALRELCKETRRPKRPELLRIQATPDNLLAVAARVAAALHFGPFGVLSDDDHKSVIEPGEQALALSRLAPGTEPGPLGSDVPCTVNELRQLTESSLLAPVGDYRWKFTHKSYREFLTAEFLQAHHMGPDAQRDLLWIGDGAARHVIPAHQEVAAWRSASDPTLFEDLLQDDPLVLLLADLGSRPAADRARVVDALLDLIGRDDVVRLDQSWALHRLDHPGLAAQLLPRLTTNQEPSSLYGVLSIARACRHPELTGPLLAIAEDRSLIQDIRVAALAGITGPDHGAVERLRDLVDSDESPEVVAAGLRQLRPDHITLTEFLNCLRDPDPNYLGMAYMLRREVPAQIAVTEIGAAAAWARGVFCDQTGRGSAVLAVSVLARALALSAQVPPGDALVGSCQVK